MSAIRVLIVDDETLGRKVIRDFLKEHTDIEIVGEAKDGRDALEQIEAKSPDLIFLDIQMPGLNGFEVVEQLVNPPVIIFSTAYDEHAIKAFDVNAVDYLLKPCAKERFAEAMDRARAVLSSRPTDGDARMQSLLEDIRRDTDYLDRLLIKEGSRITIVNLDDVLWLEAGDDYVTIHASGGNSHLVTHTLSGLAASLDPRKFIRVHRSAIINLSKASQIVSLEDGRYEVTLNDGQKVTTSRSGGRTLRDLTL